VNFILLRVGEVSIYPSLEQERSQQRQGEELIAKSEVFTAPPPSHSPYGILSLLLFTLLTTFVIFVFFHLQLFNCSCSSGTNLVPHNNGFTISMYILSQ